MIPELDPIPLDEMWKYEWWKSVFHDDWYYHTPREYLNSDFDRETLSSTLDPHLKPVAHLLWDWGFQTGPSCQGFHNEDSNHQKADDGYDSLLADADLIRNEGLVLVNVETGEEAVFRLPSYKLPWSRKWFLYQSGISRDIKGYLPFIFFSGQEFLVDIIRDEIDTIKGASISCDRLMCSISVKAKDKNQQKKIWREIHRKLEG